MYTPMKVILRKCYRVEGYRPSIPSHTCYCYHHKDKNILKPMAVTIILTMDWCKVKYNTGMKLGYRSIRFTQVCSFRGYPFDI